MSKTICLPMPIARPTSQPRAQAATSKPQTPIKVKKELTPEQIEQRERLAEELEFLSNKIDLGAVVQTLAARLGAKPLKIRFAQVKLQNHMHPTSVFVTFDVGLPTNELLAVFSDLVMTEPITKSKGSRTATWTRGDVTDGKLRIKYRRVMTTSIDTFEISKWY